MPDDRKICVGVIAGAHGVRGLVRLRSFTEDPYTIKRYKSLADEDGGREFAITIKSAASDHFVAAVKGIADRDAAEALRNTKLYVLRSALPKLRKREFYEADLIGLKVQDNKGVNGGTILAVHNYGGGPFLEIAPPEGGAYMLPFTKACVPKINMEAGHVVIDPPPGWIEDQKSPARPPRKGEEA